MNITITRALAEIKLLDKRIKKETMSTSFCDVFQRKNKTVLNQNINVDDFEREAKSKYQSIIDLIDRRREMKAKIMQSNSKNIVNINNIKYTVAEAIEYKNSIEYEKQLFAQMKNQYTLAKNQVIENSVKLENSIQQMLLQNLGNETAKNKDDWDNIAKPFIQQNELLILDPLKLEKRTEELNNEIDSFETEVDFVLSESNSINEIEIK